MAGPHTLAETERTVESRLSELTLDRSSMSVVSNLFRAANAVRNYMERTVLAPVELTWTAFVVLWVIWIWGEAETRTIAEECGVSKATLSGVLATLEGRGLLVRTKSNEDRRLVLVTLTPAGTRLIKKLFPEINAAETHAARLIDGRDHATLADQLRSLVEAIED